MYTTDQTKELQAATNIFLKHDAAFKILTA
jgi:hypothetical protein